jgi:hypothetical protein
VHDAPTTTRWIVIAAEPVTDIDVTAADMLTRLQDELRELRVNLCFAEFKGPVKDSPKALWNLRAHRRAQLRADARSDLPLAQMTAFA